MTIKEKKAFYDALERLERITVDNLESEENMVRAHLEELHELEESKEDSESWRIECLRENIEDANTRITAWNRILESLRKM